ncbi:MAG: protein kinase domain-containing protein [Thermodesulfobacteriota bacterium]
MMDRRQSARKDLVPPGICIVRVKCVDPPAKDIAANTRECFFADLLNRSASGGLLKSPFAISRGSRFQLSAYNPKLKIWERFTGSPAWIKQADSGSSRHYLIGTTLQQYMDELLIENADFQTSKRVPLESDYEFFRRTELIRSLPRDSVVPLINNVFYKKVKAGEQFINQGDHGDTCYLIQHGTCTARLEKNGESTIVARLPEGSIVGEMALLTGEPRSAHVFAETDASLWVLTRAQFDELESKYPELRTFLTNVLTRWFDSRKTIAERHIGKYIITDVIGDGAFAIVYGGKHRELDMPVAIKMMRHDMAMDPEFISAFRKEAKTIARFNHQNIVKIFDIEERYRTVFIIMELLAGRPLKQILDTRSRLTPGETVKYVRQICQGLRYAHQQKIVHMDIKPRNIFVLPDDNVKIVDFGLACPCGTETMMSGTPFYMSPEQIECLPVDTRTDIYSLGIMTYEMVTGKKPFDETDVFKLMDLHVEKDIPDPWEIAADIPESLRNMILKACARDPSERYQTVGEILDELYPEMDGFGFSRGYLSSENDRVTAVCIMHQTKHQSELERLIAELKKKVEDKGMAIKYILI